MFLFPGGQIVDQPSRVQPVGERPSSQKPLSIVVRVEHEGSGLRFSIRIRCEDELKDFVDLYLLGVAEGDRVTSWFPLRGSVSTNDSGVRACEYLLVLPENTNQRWNLLLGCKHGAKDIVADDPVVMPLLYRRVFDYGLYAKPNESMGAVDSKSGSHSTTSPKAQNPGESSVGLDIGL